MVDTDAIAHALTQQGGAAVPEIEKRFGREFVLDGAMDRKKMRDHVFADPALEVLHVEVPGDELARVASDHLPLVVDLRLPPAHPVAR